jgi:Xaa-Pro aminopeptidase
VPRQQRLGRGDRDVSRLSVPALTEVSFADLRADRLAQLQGSMTEHGLGAALFFNQANIRYATGTSVMPIYSTSALARCCIVAVDGSPVLFEYPGSVHVSQKLIDQVFPMLRDSEEWASAVRSVLADLGLRDEPLGVDVLDASRLFALRKAGLQLVDASGVSMAARRVKTKDEIALSKINGGIGDAMLHEFEAAIRPGIREFELLAVLSDALLRRQGEGLFTRLVASGRNTNPWMAEASDKIVAPGDLVGVDTDAYGLEGYLIDVSRTFLCGHEPSAAQREAYQVAFDMVQAMVELVRPGRNFEQFARAVPVLPDRYRELRYKDLAHSAGLEDEEPFVPYPEDVDAGLADYPEGAFVPGMVMCLECYAGVPGAPFGVKLEDQVLVTETGCELLSTYPYNQMFFA